MLIRNSRIKTTLFSQKSSFQISKMESSVSAPGTVVHVLSQVKYAERGLLLNETYYALQIRPSKPFAQWVSPNFILSKLLSFKPFQFDMADKNDFDRFILIPSDKYSTIEEAFKIASLCEQHKAVGVIISLPSDDSFWIWGKEIIFGEDNKAHLCRKDVQRTILYRTGSDKHSRFRAYAQSC